MSTLQRFTRTTCPRTTQTPSACPSLTHPGISSADPSFDRVLRLLPTSNPLACERRFVLLVGDVTYVVKVELGVVTISGASDSRSLITTVGQASQTFDASALVSRTDRSLYEWVEAATFTAAANSFSTTLRFEEGNFNCMDMKDVELCPVLSLSPLLSLKQQVGLWFRMDEYTDPPGTNAPPASFGSAMMIEDDTMAMGAPGADDFQGIVEVYARDSPGDLNSSWTKVAEIPGNGGWFGGTLAIDGDTLVIGANENNANLCRIRVQA